MCYTYKPITGAAPAGVISARAHTLQLASIKSIIHACILSIYLSLRFTKTFLKEAASFTPLCWTASLFLNEGEKKPPGFLRAFYFIQTFLKEERTFSFVSFIHTLLPLLSVFTNTLRLQTYRKKLSKEIEIRWILHTSKTIKTSTCFWRKTLISHKQHIILFSLMVLSSGRKGRVYPFSYIHPSPVG